jgi:tetratricopeptide (TPR) repeat protein
MRHPACAVVALLLAGFVWPHEVHAEWRQLRTASFLFIGDARDGDLRRLAETLERFRAAMAALPGFDRAASTPTNVIVFGSDRSFTPYRPHFRDRPVLATGFFLGGDDTSYIAVNATSMSRAVRAVLHEYVHFLVDDTLGYVPLWVAEGMAQLYESFQLLDPQSVAIGAPLVDHVALLRRATLMPLAELTAIDIRSVAYHEGDRRGLFYAQSWALVHYLTLGSAERAAQMRDFLARAAAGVPASDAFAGAFGAAADTIERELHDYVRQRAFRGIRIDVPEGLAVTIPRRSDPLDPTDAQAYLGDLLVRQNRHAEARALLQRVLQAIPDHPLAAAALAELEVRAGNAEEAVLRLQRTAEAHPENGLVHAALGRAWLEQLRHERHVARRRGALQEARTALARAEALEPDVLHTRALLGFAEAAVGDLERAVLLLDDAVRRAPARDQYRLMLADALIRQADDERAAAHLDLLTERGRDTAVREEAQAMLERIAVRRSLRQQIPDGAAN